MVICSFCNQMVVYNARFVLTPSYDEAGPVTSILLCIKQEMAINPPKMLNHKQMHAKITVS